MLHWLDEEMFDRLSEQASCLLGEYSSGLLLKPEGFEPALPKKDSVANWAVMDVAALSNQTPGAQYDIVFLHALPNDPDQQLLIWQQLSCLVKDTAVLFFSAWSVDTFREWRRDGVLSETNFQDMHNIGDALGQAGWFDAVMSSQHIAVTYHDAEGLMHDALVVGINTNDVSVEPPSKENPCVITYEMAFGHAIFSRNKLASPLGAYEVSIDSVRAHLQ